MNEEYTVETAETEGYEDISDDTIAAVDEDWGSDDFAAFDNETDTEAEETGSETSEADQQTEETAVEKTAEEAAAADKTAGETGEAEGKADQLFTLKHLDETREVSRDEVITLAQKGMDYDRKVGKLNNEIAEYKEFFEELAANSGLSREQFMDSVRAKLLVAEEKRNGRTLSEADAIFRVQKARSDKAKAAGEAAQKEAQEAEAARQRKSAEAVAAFAKAFPGVKASDIPKEVWDDNARNGDLLGAYTRYINAQTAKENEQLKRRIAALEQNAKNASRSLGSKKTAGSASKDSEFDALWYDGT